MGIFIAVVVTAALVWFIASKMNSGVRYEELCAERIQNAFIANGTPIEIGMARLMLRNAIDDINRINEMTDKPIFLSLTTVRDIAVGGMLYSLETGADPLESVAAAYCKHRGPK